MSEHVEKMPRLAILKNPSRESWTRIPR